MKLSAGGKYNINTVGVAVFKTNLVSVEDKHWFKIGQKAWHGHTNSYLVDITVSVLK